MKHTFISVLVPAFNEETRLPRLLESVHGAFIALGLRDYEIVVCDNNSSDSTAQAAVSGGARVVVDRHNQIARARNAAADAAGGDWLIFIDADSVLTPGLLEQTMERMNSGACLGGGALVAMNPASTPLPMRLGLATWNMISRTTGWAAGSYIFCLRSAWQEVGGFDERYYAGEEIVFSRALKRRARQLGLRFEILRGQRIVTSSRKAKEFTLAESLLQVLLCCVPGSLRRKDRLHYWYKSVSSKHEPGGQAEENEKPTGVGDSRQKDAGTLCRVFADAAHENGYECPDQTTQTHIENHGGENNKA